MSNNAATTDSRQKGSAIPPRIANNVIKATIQLDKLMFSCVSVSFQNFDQIAKASNVPVCFTFGETNLKAIGNKKGIYEYFYQVFHKGKLVGCLKFGSKIKKHKNYIQFNVANEVFYNDTLKNIPEILDNLNLKIIFFSRIDIAIDSYNADFERYIAKNLLAKDNKVKVLGRVVRDRNKTISNIKYWHQGSLNNPFRSRAVIIAAQNGSKELCAYNKMEEIKNISHKGYILDYHKRHNPNLDKLSRLEVRLMYDELYLYQKKSKIDFKHLLNPSCLHGLALKYLDRLVVFRKGKNNIPVISPDLQYCNVL